MTTYPYYIPVRFEAGILQKLFGNKKFKTHDEAVEMMKKRYEHIASINGYNSFLHSQFAIIEYTDQYEAKIVTIFNDGDTIQIISPEN